MTVYTSCSLDTLIKAYKRHQRCVKGLRDETVHGYERLVRLFVRASLGDDPIGPQRLRPPDVTAFVTSMRGRFSPHSMKTVRAALRSFLSFLRMEGLCDQGLEAAIPTVAYWRLSTLPRCLNEEQLRQVLTSLSLRTPCAFRDRAIVWCLSTLGLRPGEVAALHLDNVDWRQGTIRLRTRKTGQQCHPSSSARRRPRDRRLPAPERPRTDERRLFVQHLGPDRGAPSRAA